MINVDHMSYNVFRWAAVMLRNMLPRLPAVPCLDASAEDADREMLDMPAPPAAEPEGMLIVLHGFRQSRASLMAQLAPLRALKLPFRSLYVPHIDYDVPDLLALENSNAAIFNTVRGFCNEHVGEPLMIVGMSGGGRLAVALTNALRYVEHTHIHTITLVAPLHGSMLVGMLPGCFFGWRALLGPFADQLDTAGDSQPLLNHMLLSSNHEHRTFAHFYSTTDHLVFPPNVCVSAAGTHHVLRNCAHREALTHPDFLRYVGTFLFPPSIS